MPSIDDYKIHLIRNGYGLLFLVAATALCVLITILLWRRWAQFRQTAPRVSLGAFWITAYLTNPVIGLISVGSAIALRFKTPRLSLRRIVALALVLRLPLLFQSFWYDEAFTERLTTLALPQLPAAILADTHPPLFYSAIWFWAKLVGQSEFMLRLPSLAFGLLSVWLLYRLALATHLERRAALIAALLCAVTPAAIYYSTELRPYAMLTCAVLGALICILEDRPREFVVCTALIGWLHNLGLLYVLIISLVAYRHWEIRISSRSWKAWQSAVIFALGLGAVWLPLAILQSHAISDGFWISFNAATPLSSLLFNLMYVPREFDLPLLLPYLALLLLSFYAARRWLATESAKAVFFVAAGVPVLAILLSIFWHPVYLPRVFLPLNLIALLPLAYTIPRVRALSQIAAALLIAAVLVFFGIADQLRPPFKEIVEQGCFGASALYDTAIDTAITVAPYWSGPTLVWSGGADRGLTFMPDQLPTFGFEEGDIHQFAGERVCVVYIYTPRTLQPERDYIRRLLATQSLYRETRWLIHSELEVDVYQLDIPHA